jgi:sec-independent protein translocase protein TatC
MELVLTALFAVVGGVAWTAWVLVRGGGAREEGEERAPLPLLSLLFAAATVLAAIPCGLLLSGPLVEHVLLGLLPDGGRLAVFEVAEGAAIQLRAVGLLVVWFMLPGLLAAGWLLGSIRRSRLTALVLAVSGWIGFGLGLAVGAAAVAPLLSRMLEPQIPAAMLSYADLMSSIVAGLLALGVAGACGPVAWVLAGSSPRALRRLSLVTLLVPAGSLLVAALTTPPDVLTQVAVAAVISVCWLAGLAAGAITTVLRRDPSGTLPKS